LRTRFRKPLLPSRPSSINYAAAARTAHIHDARASEMDARLVARDAFREDEALVG
jgi:hypothetical protein